MDFELQTKSSNVQLAEGTARSDEGVDLHIPRTKKMSGFAFAGKSPVTFIVYVVCYLPSPNTHTPLPSPFVSSQDGPPALPSSVSALVSS